jgi:hypothetical protein
MILLIRFSSEVYHNPSRIGSPDEAPMDHRLAPQR